MNNLIEKELEKFWNSYTKGKFDGDWELADMSKVKLFIGQSLSNIQKETIKAVLPKKQDEKDGKDWGEVFRASGHNRCIEKIKQNAKDKLNIQL